MKKVVFVSTKKFVALYEDVLAIFEKENDPKPECLIPIDTISAVERSSSSFKITASGSSDNTSFEFSTSVSGALDTWVAALQPLVQTNSARGAALDKAPELYRGKFLDNITAIALEARHRIRQRETSTELPPPSTSLRAADRIEVCSGVFKKLSPKSSKLVPLWQERFFVLHPDVLLYYDPIKNRELGFASGAILVDEIESVTVTPDPQPRLEIISRTSSRPVVLQGNYASLTGLRARIDATRQAYSNALATTGVPPPTEGRVLLNNTLLANTHRAESFYNVSPLTSHNAETARRTPSASHQLSDTFAPFSVQPAASYGTGKGDGYHNPLSPMSGSSRASFVVPMTPNALVPPARTTSVFFRSPSGSGGATP